MHQQTQHGVAKGGSGSEGYKSYGGNRGDNPRTYILAFSISVGDCGKTGRENGDMECPNIGVCRVMYDTNKLEKGEMPQAVRSYADVTREDVQTPLGQNRLIIP